VKVLVALYGLCKPITLTPVSASNSFLAESKSIVDLQNSVEVNELYIKSLTTKVVKIKYE